VSNLAYVNNGNLLCCGENMRYVNFYNTRTDYKSMQSVDYFGDLVGMCEDPS
jgi:hypothetical protein